MMETRLKGIAGVPGGLALGVVMGLVAVCLTGCTAMRTKEAPLTDAQCALNVESFDHVWATIAEQHFDPNLNGADWEGARAELRPRVEEAAYMSQARAAMNDLIARLGQSHFGIIPAEVYEDLDAANIASENQNTKGSKRDGDVGLDVRVIDGEALVTRVDAGSPAEAAGVSTGWIIANINGRDIEPVLAKINDAYADKPSRDFVLARAVSSRLQGAVGSEVAVQFLDGRNRKVTRTIVRGPRRGHPSKFGNIPEMYVWFESRTLDGNVGYIAFSSFFDLPNVMKAFAEAIHSLHDADGVIVDLRGNPGGIGVMAMGMAGWFFEESHHYLGTMQTRNTQLKFVINPRIDPYQGPVAILVDGLSASTAEIMAGGMQDLGRARVFGTPTAAAALPSRIERLPNGDGFQYATANYVSASGRTLEGNGVIPDEEVHLTRKALLAGRDPVIEAAVAWIRQQHAAAVAQATTANK